MQGPEQPSVAEIEAVVLRILTSRQSVPRRMDDFTRLAERVQVELPNADLKGTTGVMEALWSLIGQGLIYINNYSYPSRPETWNFYPTERGKRAATDELFDPDSPDADMRRLKQGVPDVSEIVLQYASEALNAYRSRCYLASAVMLGVATEAGFLELGTAFGMWLPGDEGAKFLDFLTKPRTSYQAKFKEYRNKLEPRKNELPLELSEDIDLTFNAILNLLRLYRNEAGHPTGKSVSRSDAKRNLELFAIFLVRMYEFRAFFEANATNGADPSQS